MSIGVRLSKKVVVTGAAVAVLLGGATVAFADNASSSGTPSPSPTTTASPHAGSTTDAKNEKAGRHVQLRLGQRGVRGEVVTRGKDGTFVTHQMIRGQVKSVSSTSIVVTAADGTTETFVVGSSTTVRARSAGKATASSIGQVKVGSQVLVIGTGTSTLTARRVVIVTT